MFKIMLNECQIRDMYPDPRYLQLDFELAVVNAAKNVLGNHNNKCRYVLTFMSVDSQKS